MILEPRSLFLVLFKSTKQTDDIIVSLKGGEEKNQELLNYSIALPIKVQEFVELENIRLQDLNENYVFVPVGSNFKGIDLIAYLMPDPPREEYVLLVFQFKYKFELWESWKEFCIDK